MGAGYRIDRELGGGGMSRVFAATELELDRQVVVKVLPPDLAAGINVDRFRREIQLAARLQHPHIVPLLSAGAKGSLLYYTMPFIGGENLRHRLNRTGELPVQEAARILREVADALGYAHEQSVVHRDIKPENVLISGNHALVTDFGVSKALSKATSESPSAESSLTSLGVALGTPAYMAPEQAAADPHVDHRADIYALGIVGYELLVGRTPFSGLNQQQTLAAHITTNPKPLLEHRPQIPAGLSSAIMRCIEKRASDRWQSAAELHNALEPYAMMSGATAPTSAIRLRTPFRWTPQRIAVAAGIVGLVTTGLVMSTIAFRRSEASLEIGNTRQMTNAPGLELFPVLSPDGRMIAYTAGPISRQTLFVRQLSGGRAIALTDTSWNARFPLWSPDGSELMFRSGGKAWTVAALGGSPVPLPGLDSLAHCSWSHGGDRLACVDVRDGRLALVGGRGEDPRYLTEGGTVSGISFPVWSPNDKAIAFAKGNLRFLMGDDIGNLAPSSLWIVSAEGGEPVRISDETHLNIGPVWTPQGELLFVSTLGGARDIYLQRMGRDFKPDGQPKRLTTGLNPHSISLSRDGRTLAYSAFNTLSNISAGVPGPSPAASVATLNPVTTGNQTIEQGYVSPDGQWLAYDSNLSGNADIWKVQLPNGEPQQLTRNEVDDFSPRWSPNGREIAFHALNSGNRDVFIMDATGANQRAIVEGPGEQLNPVWLTDDVITYRVDPDSIFSVRRINGRWQKPAFSFVAAGAEYSPNGRWLLRAVDPGVVCDTCAGGLYLSDAAGNAPVSIPTPSIANVFEQGGAIVWSRDSRRAFGAIRERNGSIGIWEIPIFGNPERRIFHFTDPGRTLYRANFDVYGNTFYFPIGDKQSDIWVMELSRK